MFFQTIFISTLENAYATPPKKPENISFFNYEAEFVPPTEKLSLFFDTQQEKWKELKEKYHPDTYTPQTMPTDKKNAQKWMALCSYLKKADKIETLRGINDFMNKIPSKNDKALYNQDEYWATPDEFFKNWGGDCEDYSFAKYFGLVYLGWSLDDLWIFLFYHKELKDFHAVLIVTLDGKNYILDNLAEPTHKIILENEYKDFVVPLSALSSQGLWVFPEGVKEYKTHFEQSINLD